MSPPPRFGPICGPDNDDMYYPERSGADVEETRPKSDRVRLSHPGDYDYDGSAQEEMPNISGLNLSDSYEESESIPAETAPSRFFKVLDFKSNAEGGLKVGFGRGRSLADLPLLNSNG
uniref:Uncharacterized protein n=1 Tax=Panagrolaimus davidi TaxID=227884 RepID=A0A914QJ83_9BILA